MVAIPGLDHNRRELRPRSFGKPLDVTGIGARTVRLALASSTRAQSTLANSAATLTGADRAEAQRAGVRFNTTTTTTSGQPPAGTTTPPGQSASDTPKPTTPERPGPPAGTTTTQPEDATPPPRERSAQEIIQDEIDRALEERRSGGSSGADAREVDQEDIDRALERIEAAPPDHVFPVGGGQYNIGIDVIQSQPGVVDEAATTAATEDFDNPVHNSDFSLAPTDARHLNGHPGVDIFGPEGAPIIAAQGGEVTGVGNGSRGGNWVQITNTAEDGTVTTHYYAHLEQHVGDWEVGDTIEAGEQIGTLGDTGSAQGTSPHLHYEVEVDDVPVDPFPQFAELENDQGEPALG